MRPSLKFLSLLTIGSLSSACGLTNTSNVKTDLGKIGNQEVADTFTAYTKKSRHCNPEGNEPRVLLTGFGLFQNNGFNISGVVVQSMADERFWPKDFVSGESKVSTQPAAWGTVSKQSYGGEATMRRLTFNGNAYNVCLLILDVKWDLAGAIILHELKLFKPDAVVMTGLGGDYDLATFEGGALNSAAGLPGFHGDGTRDQDNRPIASYILPDTSRLIAPPNEIPMSWNAPALADQSKEFANTIGYSVRGLSSARVNNNYICNNVSYITLSALSGRTAVLAGRKIQITSAARNTPAGFFHYPVNATRDSKGVFVWATLWASIIPELVD